MKRQQAIQGTLIYCEKCKKATLHDEYLIPQNFKCRECNKVKTIKQHPARKKT